MKRGRVATRGSTRRTLRRNNVVVDEEDEGDAEDVDSQGEEELAEEDAEKTPQKKLTRAQVKKQEEEAKKKQTKKGHETEKEEEDTEEEEEEEEEEDDGEDDEEEADAVERRKGTRGRGGHKPQLRGSKPPPKKKQRKVIDSEDEEDEEEDTEEEEEAEAEVEDDSDDDEDDEEEEEEVKPRTRTMHRKEETKTTPRGTTRAKRAAVLANKRSTPVDKKKPRQSPKKIEETASEEEEEEEAEQQEEKTESDAEEEEEKSASEPPSAAATPVSSPAKRKGLSIDTLMNDADEDAEQEEQEDVDMTPASASASDAGTDADEFPSQHFREALSGATTEPKLMEVLTEACGRLIRESKSPSRLFSVSLLGAVKEDPTKFSQPAVLKYLLRLLRSKHYVGMKDPSDHGKKLSTAIPLGSGHVTGPASTEYFQLSLPVLVTNLLVQIMKDVDEWPVDSVKVFLDDSLYSRIWVDHELSQRFVQNVKTVLETDSSGQQPTQPLVRRRFQGVGVVQEMKDLITNHIRSRLVELEKERPSTMGGSSGVGGNHAVRNMIMTLADFASIPQVRLFGAENMEAWLQNPSVKGPAKDLLGKIVSLCKSTNSQDIATVDWLLKLKLKSTMFQLKVEAITHLVSNHPVYLKRALSMFIARERPNNMSRDVDNIKMLQHIFRASRSMSASSILGSPDDLFYRRPIEHQGTLASRELARVFREMASVSEVAPVLKTIVRKILKQLTFEQVDIKALCVGILDNDGHWDALAGDARVLDYMGLVTGVVWLILLMRGAAVKSLQIQESNSSSRQGTGSATLGSSGLKHGGTQAIPRRGSNPPLPVSRTSRLGPQKGKPSLGKPSSLVTSHPSVGSGPAGHGLNPSSSAIGSGASTEGSKTVKISVWAKEELQQALAIVQREAIICCRDVLTHFGLNGDSPFEKMLYEGIVKKLLFLDIPADVQPTEHDRTCFQSTKEDIPVHEDSLELLSSLYNSCRAIDRVEALRTLETIVFRGAEAHMHRETLWHNHENDLAAYAQSGGVLGIEVKSSQFVQHLLKLALWQGADENQEQEFCHSSRFWICCSILLIVGCFNPNTVGTFLWEEFPTLRGLMQMVITGRYTFPAIGASDPLLLGKHRTAFPDLIQGNLQLRDYEQQLLQLNQTDISVTGDPLMLFDASGLARQPPPAILEHLRTLDRKFKLGMRLRQSRTKDFLMEMVAGNDDKSAVLNANPAGAAANSAWWIADIVCEDFDTVQYLPYGCLCQLLLLALRPGNAKNNVDPQGQTPLNQPALTQIIPRLLSKLREYLTDGNDSAGVASNVVLYYLECLNSSEMSTRRIAAHIMYLLTAPRSVDELANEIHRVVASSGAEALSFSWLSELAKLPCYSEIRSRIFRSLENLLELESSIPSLRMCLKALHEFSTDSNDVATSTNEHDDIKMDGGDSYPKKSAIEQSLQLAGAYGKLLAGRDLVATLLLKDCEIYSITVEVIWRAIESQLEIAPQLKATSGISFSDCKVFYVTDGASNIREIKLPLPIIHSAIQVLCSPHAHKDPSAVGSKRTATCLAKLTQSLFPKATSNTAIVLSTGLIATKDPRLYPDHLLTKLAVAASPTTSYLCATAVRAMSSESLWGLLGQSALSEQCLEMALRAILEVAQKKESKAVASLLELTKTSDAAAAADTMLMQLSAYDSKTADISSALLEKLDSLHEWLKERSSSGLSSSMITDEDEEEALLLSEGFTTFKIQTSQPVATLDASPFYTEPMAESSKPSNVSKTGENTRTDLEIFKGNYYDEAASDENVPLLNGLVKELKRTSNTGTLPDVIAPEDFVFAASQAVQRSCPQGEDAATLSPAELWSFQTSLLHFAHSSCNSDGAAAQLAKSLLQIVGHLPNCSSAAHRQECCKWVRRALDNLGKGSAGSYSASVSFIQHLSQASTGEGLHKLDDPTVALDVYAVLHLVVQFIDATVGRWKAQSVSLHLDAMALHSLVVLVKEVEVLQRLHDQNSGISREFNATGLLTSLAQDQADDSTMLNILEPIMTADPHLGNLGDIVVIHGDVKRDLIGALYFQNPKLVAGLLDALHPGWKSLVHFDADTEEQHAMTILDRGLLSQVDDILRDLTRDGNDVMERFRELTRCHPMLVLSRFPRRLMQHFGTVSLSQLYLNTTFFQNILSAMQIIRPHLRHQQSVLEPFCQFLFEILRVIADHHAVEFHQLVAHSWELFYDALEEDFDHASELIFSTPRVLLLESIVNMYESQPETVAFGQVMAQRHSEWTLQAALESIRAGRNKNHSAASQQQQIEQLLTRIENQGPVPSTNSKPLTERTDMTAITQGLQAIDAACAKSDQGAATVALMRRCAAPVASLLVTETVTKAVMATLCQTLLNLMKFDSVCADDVMHRYVQCLRNVRPGLKEAAVNTVLDYLVFADARQRRQILQQLFDDPSEVAKTKLGVYLKSAAFRTALLVASKPSA